MHTDPQISPVPDPEQTITSPFPDDVVYIGTFPNAQELIDTLNAADGAGQALLDYLPRRVTSDCGLELYSPGERDVQAFVDNPSGSLTIYQTILFNRPMDGGLLLQRSDGQVTISSHT